jgi:trimethylamine:corrinoid methyltransferase-like protein
VDEETLAWEDLLDIAPGASFIDRDHTLRHCRDPLRPELFDRRSLEMWKAGGSKSLYSRALDKYREIKKALKPLALPDSLKKEMDHIVKRADQNLAKSVSTPARP